MGIIPKAAAEKLLKEAGAERISADAKVALVSYLESSGLEVAKEAVKIATVAKRMTVKAEDIKLSLE